MPYIDHEARERIDAGGLPETKGELNYAVTMMLVRYLQGVEARGVKLGYGTMSEGIDALHDAECEARRRLLGPYEDTCIVRNGDCYPASMLAKCGIQPKENMIENAALGEAVQQTAKQEPRCKFGNRDACTFSRAMNQKRTEDGRRFCVWCGEPEVLLPPMNHQPKEGAWFHQGSAPPVAEHKKEA